MLHIDRVDPLTADLEPVTPAGLRAARLHREAAIEHLGIAMAEEPAPAEFADALGALLAPAMLEKLHALWLRAGTREGRAAFDNAVFDGICAGFDAAAEIAFDRAMLHDEPLPLNAREVLRDWE